MHHITRIVLTSRDQMAGARADTIKNLAISHILK
jgi:hypothetical protein